MIIYDTDFEPDERLKKLTEQAVEKTLDQLKFEYEADVSLTLTDNSEIQQINKQFRNLDKPTDVLSFPMVHWPAPVDYAYLKEQLSIHLNPETNHVLLGDIVLSMDKVKSQSEEFGHSFEREFVFLIVHSMLHLLGYDHMIEAEEKEMIKLQKEILQDITYN